MINLKPSLQEAYYHPVEMKNVFRITTLVHLPEFLAHILEVVVDNVQA